MNGEAVRLASAKEALGQQIGAYYAKVEQAARDAAAKENARLMKAHAKAEVKAEAKGQDAPPPPVQVEVSVSKQVGATTVRKIWDYKVVDIQSVYPQFLDVKRGPLLSALLQMEGDGVLNADATEANPDKSMPGVLAYKRVSV